MLRWPCVLLVSLATATPGARFASAESTPTTVHPNGDVSLSIVGETGGGSRCNHGVIPSVENASVRVERDGGPLGSELAVAIAYETEFLSSFASLPEVIVIEPEESSGAAPIEVNVAGMGGSVSLTARIVESSDYGVGRGTATERIFIPPDPNVAPDCDFISDAGASNATQTLVLGGTPTPLAVAMSGPAARPNVAATFEIVNGTPPTGLTLQRDGSFAGATTSLGTSKFAVRACLVSLAGDCVEFDVTITVVAAELPTTGGPTGAAWLLLALASITIGASLRRRRPVH